MQRILLALLLLAAATTMIVPAADAAPPECVRFDPFTPNPVFIAPNGCEGTRDYACNQTVGRVLPFVCDG